MSGEAIVSKSSANISKTIVLSPSTSMLVRYCLGILLAALSAQVAQGPDAALAIGFGMAIATAFLFRISTWTLQISPEGIRCARGMSQGFDPSG